MTQNSVIITGASSGIGRGVALAFARRGYRVGLIARRTELLKGRVSFCLKRGAPQAEWLTADVLDSAVLRAALGTLDDRLGGTQIFVANAGQGGEFPTNEDLGAGDARDASARCGCGYGTASSLSRAG